VFLFVIPAEAGIQFDQQTVLRLHPHQPAARDAVHRSDVQLPQRIAEHREKLVEGFSKRYDLRNLVWFEMHDTAESAIVREKQIKKWNRVWKLELVERTNSDWRDLFADII